MRTFEQLLKNYEIGLQYFTIDDAEADVVLLDREEIESRINEATDAELKMLYDADKKADAIYEAIKNRDGYAVPSIKAIVDIIHNTAEAA